MAEPPSARGENVYDAHKCHHLESQYQVRWILIMIRPLFAVLALVVLGSCSFGSTVRGPDSTAAKGLPRNWTLRSTDSVVARLSEQEAGAIARHGWNSKAEVTSARFGLFTNRHQRAGSSLVWQDLPAWIVSLKGVPCSFEYEPKHCKVAVDLVVIDDRARTVIEEYQRGPEPSSTR
jgi:hypothetical protein